MEWDVLLLFVKDLVNTLVFSITKGDCNDTSLPSCAWTTTKDLCNQFNLFHNWLAVMYISLLLVSPGRDCHWIYCSIYCMQKDWLLARSKYIKTLNGTVDQFHNSRDHICFRRQFQLFIQREVLLAINLNTLDLPFCFSWKRNLSSAILTAILNSSLTQISDCLLVFLGDPEDAMFISTRQRIHSLRIHKECIDAEIDRLRKIDDACTRSWDLESPENFSGPKMQSAWSLIFQRVLK